MTFELIGNKAVVECAEKGTNAVRKIAEKEAAERGLAFTLNQTENRLEQIFTDFNAMAEKFDPKNAMSIESICELYRSKNKTLVEEANLQLVNKYGKYILHIINTCFPTFAKPQNVQEMFNSGVVGLISAMERYDEKTAEFITYSKNFIIHEIMNFVNFSMNANSTYYARQQKKVKKAISTLEENGEEVTVEKIMELSGLSRKAVINELAVIKRTTFFYLDDQDNTETPVSYGESVKSDPETIVSNKVLVESVERAIESLDNDTRCVLRNRIFKQTPYELIGKELGLEVDSVKKLYSSGVRKVRKMCNGWTS